MKRFTKYPCEVCGKLISNSGIGAAAHRRGKACQAVLAERMKSEPGLRNFDYTEKARAEADREAKA